MNTLRLCVHFERFARNPSRACGISSLRGLHLSRMLLSAQPERSESKSGVEVELYRHSRVKMIGGLWFGGCCSVTLNACKLFGLFPFELQSVATAAENPSPLYLIVAFSVLALTNFAASKCAYRCVLSPDRKTIGVQVHSFLGLPGKQYDIDTSKLQFTDLQEEQYAQSIVNGPEDNYVPNLLRYYTRNVMIGTPEQKVQFMLIPPGLRHRSELIKILAKNRKLADSKTESG